MKKLLITLPMAFLLSGCIIVAGDDDWDDNYSYSSSSSWRAAQADNRRKIAGLSLGDSRKVIMESMGNPEFSEAFKDKSGAQYQVLYYRTHRTRGDGETTKDETTPLVFKGDSLVGWGNDALQRIN